MSDAGGRAIDRAFTRDISFGQDAHLLAEARQMDHELARDDVSVTAAGRRRSLPAGEVGPRDVVLIDDSGAAYSFAHRAGTWVIFVELGGDSIARAHLDDLVERIDSHPLVER